MKTLEISKAIRPLADYARSAGRKPLILTENNRPVAALVALDASQDLEALSLTSNADFIAMIKRSRDRQARLGGLGLQEVRVRLGLKKDGPGERSRRTGKRP